MKNYIKPFFLAFVLCACSQETAPEAPETVEVPEKTETAPEIVPADSAAAVSPDYSAEFMKGFRELQRHPDMKNLRLEKNKIIDDGFEVEFPDFPPKNQSFTFLEEEGKQKLSLVFERVNYTSVRYSAKLIIFGKQEILEGFAHLNSGFFLGAESETGENGELIFVTEFSDQSGKYYLTIEVYDPESTGRNYRAKIQTDRFGINGHKTLESMLNYHPRPD